MRKSTIYTKTGDDGKSCLLFGERKYKYDETFEALGDLDELSAIIGLVCEYLNNRRSIEEFLKDIQSRLLDIGADLAGLPCFNPENITILENEIDTLDIELPPLKNFILPGGGLASSHAHLARAICRRFERHLVKINNENFKHIIVYINRLSDYLFVLARYMSENGDIIYKSCPLKKLEKVD